MLVPNSMGTNLQSRSTMEKGSSDAAKDDGRKKKNWLGSVISKTF